MQGVTDVVNGKMAGTLTQTTGADITRIAASLLDILGLDDRQIMMMCNRLVSDARARRQTYKGSSARFWRNEEGKWVNVKLKALQISKARVEQAREEAAIAAANEGKEIVQEAMHVG